MKRPLNREVSRVLTEKKLFHSKLNNINSKIWDEENYHEWATITGQPSDYVPEPKRKPQYVKNGRTKRIKVIRIEDGYLFGSITECIRKEGLYKRLMEEMLIAETQYKKVI